jgi:hypothetical protein
MEFNPKYRKECPWRALDSHYSHGDIRDQGHDIFGIEESTEAIIRLAVICLSGLGGTPSPYLDAWLHAYEDPRPGPSHYDRLVMSVWWRDHADHHMSVLFSTE